MLGIISFTIISGCFNCLVNAHSIHPDQRFTCTLGGRKPAHPLQAFRPKR